MAPGTPAIVRRELEPTHPCIRCGREGVPADSGLCELCNPLELSQPSATQMHGIAAVGILAFVAILALVARVALAGTGPFIAQVSTVEAAAGGLSVTLSVTNEGSNATATTCQVREVGQRSASRVEVVQMPSIGAGQTVEVTRILTRLGAEPVPLVAQCGAR
jgi:hypothetical protein